MDDIIEFNMQAYAKMIMHTIKYAHNNCGGFLLGQKEIPEGGHKCSDENGDTKDTANCESQIVDDTSKCQTKVLRIIDAIPVAHASLGLEPNTEVAFNSVSMYALQQDLVICGYYHTDKLGESSSPDLFSQKITEKICQSYPRAILCFIKFEPENRDSHLMPHQLVEGKWRRKTNNFSVEFDPEQVFDKVILTKDRLYREIVDFDDHFNNIALDWTNSKISQKIDHLVAQVF